MNERNEELGYSSHDQMIHELEKYRVDLTKYDYIKNVLSVNDIAKMLAYVAPSKSRSYYARQIRGWAQRGLLMPHSKHGVGATASRIFSQDDIYRARLLSHLTMLGFSPQIMIYCVYALESIAERMTHEEVKQNFKNHMEGKGRIKKNAFDKVRDHEKVFLIILIDANGDYIRAYPCDEVNVLGYVDVATTQIINLSYLFGPIVSLEQRESHST